MFYRKRYGINIPIGVENKWIINENVTEKESSKCIVIDNVEDKQSKLVIDTTASSEYQRPFKLNLHLINENLKSQDLNSEHSKIEDTSKENSEEKVLKQLKVVTEHIEKRKPRGRPRKIKPVPEIQTQE